MQRFVSLTRVLSEFNKSLLVLAQVIEHRLSQDHEKYCVVYARWKAVLWEESVKPLKGHAAQAQALKGHAWDTKSHKVRIIKKNSDLFISFLFCYYFNIYMIHILNGSLKMVAYCDIHQLQLIFSSRWNQSLRGKQHLRPYWFLIADTNSLSYWSKL